MLFRRASRSTDDLTTQRIEAFSDGVLAIAITLLILEIKVPQVAAEKGPTLGHSLLTLWPSYIAYVLSFLMIGIYWANHHYVFQLYQHTDHFFNLLNVLFLMCISFLPFPTAVLGDYISHPPQRQSAISFYSLGLLLPAVGWSCMWFYACKAKLLDERLDKAFVVLLTKQYVGSLVLYFFSFVVSFWLPIASILLSVVLTLLFLRPPIAPVYIKEEESEEAQHEPHDEPHKERRDS
jgi:uncharacterized membrane protein